MAGVAWFLLGTSLVTMPFAWKTEKLKRLEVTLKMPCPACGVHIAFDQRNLGQMIPCPQCLKEIKLRTPDNLKMSCFFCQGHIEFPAHALGKKMPCPHCHRDITLKKPV
jgi:predicted RNA-binding Zn-ribbon protein involved in translation (DUF1610 family)